jgi:hypothetical protein
MTDPARIPRVLRPNIRPFKMEKHEEPADGKPVQAGQSYVGRDGRTYKMTEYGPVPVDAKGRRIRDNETFKGKDGNIYQQAPSGRWYVNGAQPAPDWFDPDIHLW